MKIGLCRAHRVMPWLAIFLLCVMAGHVAAQSDVEADREVLDALSNNQADTPSAIFVPVILTAAGRNNSFFTSELTLTNRSSETAILNYTYTPHRGDRSYTATDMLGPLQQTIKSDAIAYLRELEVPIPETGSQIGTLRVDVTGSSEVAVLVRTTTAVPEGRAGLAFPGIPGHEGFHDEAVYLCGLRQNRQDRSNVALQNMGAQGEIILRTTVFSGEAADMGGRRLDDRTLKPGGFYQHNEVLKELGSPAQGYVKVERMDGEAPFYAYGVINDQANSDGSFVFPVGEDSLAGAMGQTLPVVIEVGPFTSELTVTNFSDEAKTVSFSVVADAIEAADDTAIFTVLLAAGQQRIIPNAIDAARQQFGLNLPSGLAVPLFARAVGTDVSGIVIGARTGSPADPEDSSRGQYSVFYSAVPQGAGFTGRAWVNGLQQNEENRSNLALVNTGEVDDGDIVFTLEIYDGKSAMLVNTVSNPDTTVKARRWHQINGILRKYGKGATQGFVRITKTSGDNPFLAYGVVNDGGIPRQRSDDGAYLPAVEERTHDPGTVPMADREVLERLYHATGGPDWNNRTNWLSTLPVSEWYGVGTDGSGQVTSLSLTRNGLNGTIPPTLGQLIRLERLELGANKLNGAIPPELAGIAHLWSLELSDNELSGAIPRELADLTQLQTLNLSSNELSGSVPQQLGKLSRLQLLNLFNNELSGAIPTTLQELSELTTLDIEDTDVCVPKDAAILEWLGKLLSFHSSGLVCDGTRRMFFSAPGYELREGETVKVSVRLIDQTGNPVPSVEIGLTARSGGGATAEDYSGVPERITIVEPANEAGFFFTAVADETFDDAETVLLGFRQPLPSGITAGSPDTATVTIYDSGTEGETEREALEALYHATGGPNWKNHTNWRSAAPLSEWFGVTTDESGQVTNLSLSSNGLSGRIPRELGQLTLLKELDLDNNRLGGGIPPELGQLTHLQRLSLRFNRLSGRIPRELGQLTLLKELDLDNNRLGGGIPPELGQLTHLQRLSLRFNDVSRAIPPELGQLILLQELDLESNRLSGAIPPELGQLSVLQSLSLRANQMSGAIPLELTQLTNLERLDLGINELSGGIPPELGQLSQLQVLDLNNNLLRGTIPPELSGLTQLQWLFLMANQLSGGIPPELGQLSQLRAMNLELNQLIGAIPPDLGQLTLLQDLELDSNQLSGGIPPELTQLATLRGLDLGFNPDLTGTIPPGLEQLPLSTLNLMATSVCVPEDAELQEWFATIDFNSSGLTCGRPTSAVSSIDLLVIYTPAARRHAGGTTEIETIIDLMIAETNQAYVDSGANQHLVLVARQEVEYTESGNSDDDLFRLMDASDGHMDEVHAIRDGVGADLVHLIAQSGNLAVLPGAFAMTCGFCDSDTFAHEIGHNMGLSHDRYVDGGRGLFPYSHGYVNQQAFAVGAPQSARWRTIMAYPSQCGNPDFSCDRIMRFSNPNHTYLGDPLGVPGVERTTAVNGPSDAVRTLNVTRHSVAGLRHRASGTRLSMSETVSQPRSLVRTGSNRLALPVPGGNLFRVIPSNGEGSALIQAAGLINRAALRHREVSVDNGRLAQVLEGSSTTLRLNLFNDVVLTGVIEQWTPTYTGGFALSGRLVGVAGGTVTLVVNGSVVASTVRIPGATYRIRPAGKGRHVIMQVDPSQSIQGCEVVRQTPDRRRTWVTRNTTERQFRVRPD